MIEAVTESNIRAAATVHSIAWQASHDFCTPAFVAAHTPERQEAYLRDKLRKGSRIFLLTEDVPLALVSVTGSLIADLYVLPERQNRGFGTRLLHFAMAQCESAPTLWILEINRGAERLYRREGFVPTGRSQVFPNGLHEYEFRLNK